MHNRHYFRVPAEPRFDLDYIVAKVEREANQPEDPVLRWAAVIGGTILLCLFTFTASLFL